MKNIIMVSNTLILGIDIAKDNHYGQFVVNGEYMKTLVGMEPIDYYWKNIMTSSHFLEGKFHFI